jgi:hypothetical protein
MVDACGCCYSREGNKQQVVLLCWLSVKRDEIPVVMWTTSSESRTDVQYVIYLWFQLVNGIVCLSFYSFWSFDVKGLLYLVKLLHMKFFTCTHALAVEFLVWMIISVSWNILWRNKWSGHLSLFLPSLCIFSWIACYIECSTLTKPR